MVGLRMCFEVNSILYRAILCQFRFQVYGDPTDSPAPVCTCIPGGQGPGPVCCLKISVKRPLTSHIFIVPKPQTN